MLYPLIKVKQIIERRIFIWDTQKSTEDEEKWDQKREEPVKETKENRKYRSK